MILVDTSVWIEFLEGQNHWSKSRLKEKISDFETVGYIDMILLEIIQGIRERKERELIESKFQNFTLLPVKRSSVMLAAEIYQELQRKGIRVRSGIDCLISAIGIETGAVILHKDRDFDFIARYFPIIVEKP